jgi:hypothetical protein
MPEGEFERRLADVQHGLSPTPAEAQKAVREVLAQFRQKLEFQLQVVTLREDADDLRAQADAAGTPTKESVLRLRYLRESDRGCQGALRELRRLQEWRLKHGAELGMQAPADASGPATAAGADIAPKTEAETPPAEAPAGPRETVSRTEAAAPQVGGQSSSCNANSRTDPAVGRDGVRPFGLVITERAAETRPDALEKPPPG